MSTFNNAADRQGACEWSPWDPMLNEAPAGPPKQGRTFQDLSSQEFLGSYFGFVSPENGFPTSPAGHSSDHNQSQRLANEYSVTAQHEVPSDQRVGFFCDKVALASEFDHHPHEPASRSNLPHVVTDASRATQLLGCTHHASNVQNHPLPIYLPQQPMITHPIREGLVAQQADFEAQPGQIPTLEAEPSNQTNTPWHQPSQVSPYLADSFISGVEVVPLKGLLFANNGQAQQAFTQRSIPHAWIAPTPDPSLPNKDKKTREEYVGDLITAFMDLSEAQDLSRMKDLHIFYMSPDIEAVCWELLSIAEKLHRHGPSSLRIFSKSKLAEAYKTRHMTFEIRIAHICGLLRLSKSRCESILGYNDLETIIACPADKVKVSKSSKKLNTTRQHQLNEGRDTLARQVCRFMQLIESF